MKHVCFCASHWTAEKSSTGDSHCFLNTWARPRCLHLNTYVTLLGCNGFLNTWAHLQMPAFERLRNFTGT